MEQHAHFRDLEPSIAAWIAGAQSENAVERIRQSDVSLWKENDEGARQSIENRLGWLNAPQDFLGRIDEIQDFADEIHAAGFTHAVLLGMGGSSLCVEVIRDVIGVAPGYPQMHILDSTHPAQVRAIERAIDLDSTLFIVASKSGTTLETECFYLYFWEMMTKRHGEKAAEFFVAITDPDSKLALDAERLGFRKTFLNPANIGGRFSVLSYFGLVPAALMGVRTKELLERALEESWRSKLEENNNPGFALGALMGIAEGLGRNCMKIQASATFAPLFYWIEQLVAESTGKEGKGVLPVAGASLGSTDAAIEVSIGLSSEPMATRMAPGLDLVCEDVYDLGALFYRWEFATAVAGIAMHVNPFDEPNVTESKNLTNKVLLEGLPDGASNESSMPAAVMTRYVGILAYVPHNERTVTELAEVQRTIEAQLRVPVTVGFGPRFLHSTGQLHKGGPKTGTFIQFVEREPEELPIPTKPFGFGTLLRAQAEGDYQALKSKGLQVVRIRLNSNEGVKLPA